MWHAELQPFEAQVSNLAALAAAVDDAPSPHTQHAKFIQGTCGVTGAQWGLVGVAWSAQPVGANPRRRRGAGAIAPYLISLRRRACPLERQYLIVRTRRGTTRHCLGCAYRWGTRSRARLFCTCLANMRCVRHRRLKSCGIMTQGDKPRTLHELRKIFPVLCVGGFVVDTSVAC
jgi:hypothetical protein